MPDANSHQECGPLMRPVDLSVTRPAHELEMDPAAPTSAPAVPIVHRLRDRIRATLQPLVRDCTDCALMDFPDHSNVGDSAIWVGELAWLAESGVRIRYRCDVKSYDRTQLERAARTGPILIHGGGNLGDLWRRHQRLREQVIRDFPDRHIIQLPQTMYFRDRDALARTREVFDAHPNLTLLLRDQPSLELARQEFRAPSLLCPDTAFYVGPLAAEEPPDLDVLWLRRQDQEAVDQVGPEPPDLFVCDWLDEDVPALRRVREVLRPLAARERHGLRVVGRLVAATYDLQARQRLRVGCRLLARGRVVITDRLHGHILCLLLGIPHVLLDNNYGKVRRFYETWTAAAPQVRWAESASEAVAAARTLLQP